ncbi:hypothetical protein GCM10009304_34120 [Pseudomonas matsuisoli]|uniref:Uncharacterized protein n=1 Tax=Pseudomonas matsuisoli TaxID=1515666 RepID=A0A917Q1C4_9PSED|nr:hypothetical protein GCM10009304_34120 [Pseudomonas matsuisoli]
MWERAMPAMLSHGTLSHEEYAARFPHKSRDQPDLAFQRASAASGIGCRHAITTTPIAPSAISIGSACPLIH